MSPVAYVVLAVAYVAAVVCIVAFCRAAADPSSDFLGPHPDEQDAPAPVFDLETGEPIRDLDAWCVSVTPDRRRPTSHA